MLAFACMLHFGIEFDRSGCALKKYLENTPREEKTKEPSSYSAPSVGYPPPVNIAVGFVVFAALTALSAFLR